jgi:hypothetical protein
MWRELREAESTQHVWRQDNGICKPAAYSRHYSMVRICACPITCFPPAPYRLLGSCFQSFLTKSDVGRSPWTAVAALVGLRLTSESGPGGPAQTRASAPYSLL